MLKSLRVKKNKKIKKPELNNDSLPISNSYKDLKYLSSLCYTKYNGAIESEMSEGTSNSKISPEIKNIQNINEREKGIKYVYNFSPNKNFISNSTLDDSLRKSKKLKYSPSSQYIYQNNNSINNINNGINNSNFKLNHSQSQQKIINNNKNNKFNFELNKKSSIQSLQDFKNNLNNLENKYLSRLKEKYEEYEKTSNILNENIESLNNNLLRSGKELNLTKEKNVFVNNENMKMNYNFKRMKLENKNNDDDIKNLREEINELNNEISRLNEQNVEYSNQIMDYNNKINDMKSKIRILPDLIYRCEEDRKNLSRAIVIIQKKSQEIKRENYKIDIARDYLGQDLEATLEIYKSQGIA